MIDVITMVNRFFNDLIWGPYVLFFMICTGIYLSYLTGFIQITKLKYMWENTMKTLFSSRKKQNASKNVTPFQAVTTALASSIGVGNVAGVSGALVLGGAGAIFWMWVSAFFGMATKYAEIVLSVYYRKTNPDGTYSGGPMYYIERGLGKKWLAVLFAAFGGLASFGIGNIAQASEISSAVQTIFQLPQHIYIQNIAISTSVLIGIIVALLCAVVIIGGIKRIGKVTEIFVPFMAVFYIAGCFFILLFHLDKIPGALLQIFSQAFSLQAVGGGISGYAITRAIRYGVARGIFSNEAGLGSAPIAHAATSNKNPVKQGIWAIFEIIVDSFLICTVTALVVIISGKVGETSEITGELLTGGTLTAYAFDSLTFGFGGNFVRISLILFALSTLFGWSYYGQVCFSYLFHGSERVIHLYKVLFALAVVVGSSGGLSLMWEISDTLNGFMTVPNMIAVAALSGKVKELTDSNFSVPIQSIK